MDQPAFRIRPDQLDHVPVDGHAAFLSLVPEHLLDPLPALEADVDLLCILFFVPLRGFVQCLFIILRHDQLPSIRTECPDLYMHMHIFVSLILTWEKKFVQCDSMFGFSMYYLY